MKHPSLRPAVSFGLTVVLLSLVLMIVGLTETRRSGPINWLFSSQKDGSWRAVTIDGKQALDKPYLIEVRRGKVHGGVDGCNHWAVGAHTTAMACEGLGLREAYYRLARSHDVKLALAADGSLRLRKDRHEAVFLRCPQTNRSDPIPEFETCEIR
jgi:hypothetical protein